ncbi:hypothetical protein [Saccharopolyspora mangrovi]|uniref:Uncharacterized protein n=1 Tax=Saccharopolyspora mangrovi TaxID=3082379 RepID=A0ABU6ACK9_9PSEU|nr:hypothetical protein [Saccharopolyspora sp. S2-29]MEB3369244.1 hypothetical protein [Saccharopolyspora sp. S2-29]
MPSQQDVKTVRRSNVPCRLVALAIAAATALGLAPAAQAAIDDPAQHVNPFVGTKPGEPAFGHGGLRATPSPARWHRSG